MGGAVLVASQSAFLRMSLVRQLKQRAESFRTVEAASATEAMRILSEGAIEIAIVDEALLTAWTEESFAAALGLDTNRTVLIATGAAARLAPQIRQAFLMIDGAIEGVLNMGAIASALPHALDHLAAVPRRHRVPPVAAPVPRAVSSRCPEVILVAASTGGPTALASLLKRIGRSRLPIVVAQHMPADQTAGFARHLAAETGLEVAERASGEIPSAPVVTVLRGGADYRLARGNSGRFRLRQASCEGNVFHPNADLLFVSAAETGIAALAVVLSGMGEDGARGATVLAARGGRVLVQEFASCVVAGMPTATFAACPSATVASLRDIAEHVSRWSDVSVCTLGHRAGD
jgi:two-component system, chemotaxis family, protein-glutamate methylesterase/glutaminase